MKHRIIDPKPFLLLRFYYSMPICTISRTFKRFRKNFWVAFGVRCFQQLFFALHPNEGELYYQVQHAERKKEHPYCNLCYNEATKQTKQQGGTIWATYILAWKSVVVYGFITKRGTVTEKLQKCWDETSVACPENCAEIARISTTCRVITRKRHKGKANCGDPNYRSAQELWASELQKVLHFT